MKKEVLDRLRTSITAAMIARSTNPRRLAIDAGLGQTVIRDLLQREETDVKLGTLGKIADALDMPLGQLISSAEDWRSYDTEVRRDLSDAGIEVKQVDLAYSMGPGTNVDDFPEETPIIFDASFLRRVTKATSDRLFVARGSGDSMMPTLINDDQVLVDTTQRTLNLQDRIWAVSVYGVSMIKRLRAIGSDRVRIMSDNATIPPEEVPAEDLYIVGRVVWIGRQV